MASTGTIFQEVSMKSLRLRSGYVLLVLLTGFSFTPRTGAQTVFGNIAGTITDSTGAVVAGAKVQAVDVNSGTTLETISTSAGSYRLPQVPIGTFDINVSAPGFQQQRLTGVQVTFRSPLP